jgi:hypothetical protein
MREQGVSCHFARQRILMILADSAQLLPFVHQLFKAVFIIHELGEIFLGAELLRHIPGCPQPFISVA